MLGLEYHDQLRKRAELIQEVKDTFDIDNANSAYTMEIVLPVIKVLLYATSHEVRHIKEHMEELDCNLEEDGSSSFYTERLELNNLFKCLRLLAPDCLWAVLERLKSHHTGAIEELKKNILSNDFDGFVSALNKYEINTEPITPISNFLFFQIRLDGLRNGFLELYEMTNKTEKEQSLQEIKDKALRLGSDFIGFMQDWSSSQHLDKIGAVYYESFERALLSDDFEQRLYNDDQLFSQEGNERDFAKSIKKVYPNFVEDSFKSDEFIITRYKEFLSGYCQYIQDFPNLSTFAKIEIERLLKSKYFEPIWSRFDMFDDNTAKVLEKEIDEYYMEHGILVDGANETAEEDKGTQQTPQIEEFDMEEVEEATEQLRSTKERRRGRPKSTWIKGRPGIKDKEIGLLIEKYIWDWLIEKVGELKFNKGISNYTKNIQIKNLSAGLLYYVAEEIGWAEKILNGDEQVQSSFKRTMEFAGVSRSSFSIYIRHLHDWYIVADQYKDYSNQFNECYSEYKSRNPNMAFLIFQNVKEIGDIIEKLKIKLKKTLDEHCKF